MTFMAAYLRAPAPVTPQGLVSLSLMGGDTEGRPLSVLSSTRYGGSGGSACSFHPDSSSSPAPLRSTRLVNHLSHPPASWGDAHCCPDPEPCEQVFNRTPSYGSGHAPSYGSPRLVPSSVGFGGRPGGQDAGNFFVLIFVWTYSSSWGGARAPRTSTQTIGLVLHLRTDVLLISGGARTPRPPSPSTASLSR